MSRVSIPQSKYKDRVVDRDDPLPIMSVPFEAKLKLTRPANTTQYTANDIINSGPTVDCAKVNDSKVITPTTTRGIFPGMTVTGTGIQANTTVVSVDDTTVTLNKVASAVKQVETATAAGTVTATGDAEVVVTAAGMTGTPKTFAVAVAENDTPELWAAKVRAALAADAAVDALFDVSGDGAAIVLTANDFRANDSTLNVALATGTATGITTTASSANTTAGIATTVSCVFASVTLHAIDMTEIGAEPDQVIELTSAIISSSNGDASTKLQAIVGFYDANNPQTDCSDNTAWAPTFAQHDAHAMDQFEAVTTAAQMGSAAYDVKQAGVRRFVRLDSEGKLYPAIIAANAYTPDSAEQLTLTIKGLL